MTTTTFPISGLLCSACVAKTTAALPPFAARVIVTLNPPEATLDGATTTNLATLNTALAKAGACRLAAPAAPVTAAIEQDDGGRLARHIPAASDHRGLHRHRIACSDRSLRWHSLGRLDDKLYGRSLSRLLGLRVS